MDGITLNKVNPASIIGAYLLLQTPTKSLFETPSSKVPVEDVALETQDISSLFVTAETAETKVAEMVRLKDALLYEVAKTRTGAFPGIAIGRNLDNDIVLNDETLSKFHGWLKQDEDSWHYTDAGSRNGSRINGVVCEAKKRYRIHFGDELILAGLVFQFIDEVDLRNLLAYLEG